MNPATWRTITLAYGVALLATIVLGIYAQIAANGDPGFRSKPVGNDLRRFTVTAISNRGAIAGRLEVGDQIELVDTSYANRALFDRARPGDRFTFARTDHAGRTSTFVDTIAAVGPNPTIAWPFDVMAIVFALVALTIAARRPQDELARRLVGFLLAIDTILGTGPISVLPLWVLVGMLVVHLFAQAFALYAALALAVTFPHRSVGGVRSWLERANPWLLTSCVITLFGLYGRILLAQQLPPLPANIFGLILTAGYYAAITVAFVLAGRNLDRADARRLAWVAWTLAAGFSGEIVLLALIALRVPQSDWTVLLNLTLLAIPFGLAYAIVRHRVVDIGFVVNRALDFAIVSGIVLLAFAALEWLLGNVLVKVSHVTSASLELGLALVLGFSLRSIHLRVDGLVDHLFFRDRHRSEHALRVFAREVGYITDPRIAIDRTHQELLARSGASSVAIYVVVSGSAVRVDPSAVTAMAPVGVDDPALVRMRATREAVVLGDVRSALAGEIAFPMTVRDAISGAIALGSKANGEAYAPDELATVAAVALALGNALDALQTAALRRDIGRVLGDGVSIEVLRRTIDAASWIDAVIPQPAGSLLGLGE